MPSRWAADLVRYLGVPVEWVFVGKPQFRFGRMLMLAAMIAAAGLAGCGRKGALDPPPTAAITDPQQVPPGAPPNAQTAQAQPAAPPPPPPRRWFPLDFLLN
jgi:predicted small lipoprotein YifL